MNGRTRPTKSPGGRPVWGNLLLLALTLAAVLLAMEGLARLWLRLAPPAVPARTLAERVIQTDWFGNLKSGLVSAGSVPDLYVPDSDLFWTLRPGADALVENTVYQTKGEPVRWRLRINADGHRGGRYPDGRGPDRPVIAALGDSCTFGFRVNDEETYPAQLQQVLRASGLPGATVVNYGVPGYSSFQGRRLLAKILTRHRPDAVILSFGANDREADRFSDAEKARRAGSFGTKVALALRNLAVGRVLLGASHRARAPVDGPGLSSTRVSPEEYAENMRAMIREARQAGAAVVLLDLVFTGRGTRDTLAGVARSCDVPLVEGGEVLARGLDDLLSGRRFTGERAAIDRFWDERVEGYRMLDFDEAFYRKLLEDQRWGDLLRYLMVEPVHPNALGHRLIAEEAARVIRSLNLERRR